ncbi:SRPBCC family protein [Candidatus Erwinia haradaeae]|uniref:Ribosome association toxin RatA n=1 Tax=Candidatus Erwinia haradaeae TaxID=1922217 RepID=A0A451D3D1_9GAMM|nr:SRPBCC family protein [Candidatus Erwinia haradaeae]VFP80165.1 Ribosome association toxin RatA [Candidatus Erwinia haradaeae]
MPQINHSLLMPFSTEKMYHLVNDIKSYPQFLSGCIASQVVSVNYFQMTAAIEISIAGIIHQTLVTRNTLMHNHSINIELLEGPFKQLNGMWLFHDKKKEMCQVQLSLNIEFTNILMEMTFQKIVLTLNRNLLETFRKRAQEVYTV